MIAPITPESKERVEEILTKAAQDISFREALLEDPESTLESYDLSPDEKFALSTMKRVALEEWGIDVRNYRAFLILIERLKDYWSPQGRTLAVGDRSGFVITADTSTRRNLSRFSELCYEVSVSSPGEKSRCIASASRIDLLAYSLRAIALSHKSLQQLDPENRVDLADYFPDLLSPSTEAILQFVRESRRFPTSQLLALFSLQHSAIDNEKLRYYCWSYVNLYLRVESRNRHIDLRSLGYEHLIFSTFVEI